MQKTRVKLSSTNYKQLTEICNRIISIADKTGVKHSGLIALPTKKLVLPVRKSPCGGGTETYEKWQLRIHKRMIDIRSNEKMLKRIMRIEFPETVHVEIEFIE